VNGWIDVQSEECLGSREEKCLGQEEERALCAERCEEE